MNIIKCTLEGIGLIVLILSGLVASVLSIGLLMKRVFDGYLWAQIALGGIALTTLVFLGYLCGQVMCHA
jgi:hypothetical protein